MTQCSYNVYRRHERARTLPPGLSHAHSHNVVQGPSRPISIFSSFRKKRMTVLHYVWHVKTRVSSFSRGKCNTVTTTLNMRISHPLTALVNSTYYGDRPFHASESSKAVPLVYGEECSPTGFRSGVFGRAAPRNISLRTRNDVEYQKEFAGRSGACSVRTVSRTLWWGRRVTTAVGRVPS